MFSFCKDCGNPGRGSGSGLGGEVDGEGNPQPSETDKKLPPSTTESKENEPTLLKYYQSFPYLFDMTGLDHGESINTTSQAKRPATGVASATGPPTKSQKITKGRIKKGTASPRDTKDLSGESFRMEEWGVEKFQRFLGLANDDISRLESVPANALSVKAGLYCKESLASGDISDEAIVNNAIKKKFSALEAGLRMAFAGECICLGLREAAQKKYSSEAGGERVYLGPDPLIDFLFLRKVGGRCAQVGWEDKVPWNYPGRSLTDTSEDFARLGRDVSLVDVAAAGESPIPSPADPPQKSKVGIADGTKMEFDDEKTDDDVSKAPSVATRAGTVQPQTSAASERTYKVKLDNFPPQQIVSYMLSRGMRYTALSTGYRHDFCRLDLDSKNDKLVLKVAGPFWSVGGINKYVLQETNPASGYYTTRGVRKYGNLSNMAFGAKLAPGAHSTVNLVPWSTDILGYPHLEGLLRFFLSATNERPSPNLKVPTELASGLSSSYKRDNDEENDSNDDDVGDATDGTNSSPHFVLNYPNWYANYARKSSSMTLQRLPPTNISSLLPFSNAKEITKYTSTIKIPVGDSIDNAVDFGEVFKKSGYLKSDKSLGLTRFGPLNLADLVQGTQLRAQSNQDLIEGQTKAKLIGTGRNGNAYRANLRTCDLVCKVLCGGQFDEEKFEERVQELKWEMDIYHTLGGGEGVQGKAVPRFLYAGLLIDKSQWIFPEQRSEIYGFATTWAGHSLDSKSGLEVLRELENSLGKAELRTHAKAQLSMIHGHGILHNDVEARNVVCDGESIRFVDFGNALTKDEVQNWEAAMKRESDKLAYLLSCLSLD